MGNQGETKFLAATSIAASVMTMIIWSLVFKDRRSRNCCSIVRKRITEKLQGHYQKFPDSDNSSYTDYLLNQL